MSRQQQSFFEGGGNMDDDIYSKVLLDRKGARQIGFSILEDIELYVATHIDEYEQFLQKENLTQTGDERDEH